MKTYSRYDLAKKTGVSEKQISRIFSGKGYYPIKHEKAIIDYIGITSEQFKDLFIKARKIENFYNPYKKHLYRNGTFKRVIWSTGEKLSLHMFDKIYSTLPDIENNT